MEHAQEALHYVDVSTSFDDMRHKNIVMMLTCLKLYIDFKTCLS